MPIVSRLSRLGPERLSRFAAVSVQGPRNPRESAFCSHLCCTCEESKTSIETEFQTSFSSFIADISTNFNEPIYRAGHVQQIHPTDEKIRVMPLFPFDNELNFELFVIELLPSCEHLSPPHEHGVIEHVVVVDGTIEVLVDGVWKSLSKGEGLRFNANQVHGYRNITSKTSSFHDIIHYPPKL